MYLFALSAFVVMGIYWFLRAGQDGVPLLSRKLAHPVLEQFRLDPRITQLGSRTDIEWETPAWWLYSAKRGVFLGKVGRMCFRFRWILPIFVFLVAVLSWTHLVMPSWSLAFSWGIATIWFLSGWSLPLDALVKLGNWDGANGKSNISFPLVVLMEDLS
ncbi:hypothetical protein ACJU26_09125 [Acidithiobacillus sp. M4-SHS-6]|uniref:hypothetical protein n=1 Tax=Acidithiobacillus sp. M4-SHS-6 TaxID=3383024 RepID=UPI0039BE1D78